MLPRLNENIKNGLKRNLMKAFAPALSTCGLVALVASLPVAAFASESIIGETLPAGATTIGLPDGTECNFAGQGATLAYEGKRLNYTCSDTIGLIGEVVVTNGTEITVDVATIAGTTITGSELLTFTISAVELADDSICLNAGQGATLTYSDRRLNFTCAPDKVLIGDVTTSAPTFTVDQAFLEGTRIVEPIITEDIVALRAEADLASSETAMITGTITYPQRIALPPNATVVVTLENVSRADAPSEIIAEETFQTAGQQVPIPFSLSYDPTDIEARDRYVVRAKIFYGNELSWTSTIVYPVITYNNPTTDVDLLMEQVGSL